MACFPSSKAKKGYVFNEGISSCNRCIFLGRLCIPRVSQCTNQSSVAIAYNSNSPIPNKLLTDRMTSTLCVITDQVDGHDVVLCHKSSIDIITHPTWEPFDNFSSPPNKMIINRLGNIGGQHPHHPPTNILVSIVQVCKRTIIIHIYLILQRYFLCGSLQLIKSLLLWTV